MHTSNAIAAQLWPHRPITLNLGLIVGGAGALALISQVAVPIGPVPISMQTLGVLLIGALYGSRLGIITVVSYLAAGAVGLPVFAAGNSGPIYLFLGPTSGYLWGFALAAGIVGYVTERGRPGEVIRTVAAMLLGSAAIYGAGLLVLRQYVPTWEGTLAAGMYPFLWGDGLKLALATAVVVGAQRWLAVRRSR